MSRSILVSVLASLLVPAIAAADPTDTQPTQVETVQALPYPHNQHAQCHAANKLLDRDPYCGPIRSSERNTYSTQTAKMAKEDIVLDDGSHTTGVRKLYDKTLVTGFTSEATYSAIEWISRFKIPAYDKGSAHQTWEDGSIDDCNEYVYKRYYAPNRYLDVLGTLSVQRRWNDALDVIANGIPSVNGTKAVIPIVGLQLLDYDYRAIEPFDRTFSQPALPAMAPVMTGQQPRNVFYGASTLIKQAPATSDPQWDADLQSAWLKSNGPDAFVTYPSSGEFGWAYQERSVPDIANLSNGERDDIARRVRAYRDALQRAMWGFDRCITDEFLQQSASANTLGSVSVTKIGEFLEANQPGEGYTYPVDEQESDLLNQLLTSDTVASAALDNLLAANLAGTDKYAAWARTRSGSMLRLLANFDKPTVQNAVTATRTALKGSYTFGRCVLSDDFAEVRNLLVAEYRRGDAGCMSANHRCDFSAPVFVDDVMARMSNVVWDSDKAKDFCVKVAGNNFDGGTTPVSPTVRTKLADFESFLAQRYQQIEAQLSNAPRSSSLPDAIGNRTEGGSTWGDSGSFKAGYNYSAEWGVNVLSHNAAGDACYLGGKVAGSLHAWAQAYGVNADLVNAGLSVTTKQPDGSGGFKDAQYQAHLTLNGAEQFTPINQTTIDPSLEHDADSSMEIPVVKTTVVLGIVPVSIEVKIGFDYGYKLTLGFNQTNTCKTTTPSSPALTVSGSISPHAGAAAIVSAYVDLFLVGAGVEGKLTLVDAQLPFAADLKTSYDTTNGLRITTESSAKLILTELSGSISFIVNVLGFTVWQHELFSWPGISQTVSMWNDSGTYNINAFNWL